MKFKILLVEDNAIERAALIDILRTRPDLEITEAEDGQAALELLRGGFQPDLCITDLQMPRLDGRQLIESLRRDPALAGLKTVVASSVRDRERIVALAQLHIAGYLLKPFDQQKTRAVLNQVLGPPPALVPPPAPAKTLLLVDDQEIHRAALVDIVRSVPGWTVIEAADGQDAWERLRAGLRPHLAMFDLKMPRLDGTTLLQQIRDDPDLRGTRVVIVSSTQDREQILALARLQIAGYLLKPFDAEKVKQAVRGAGEAADTAPEPSPAGPAP
jgi:CheY-like chemotaxis protein